MLQIFGDSLNFFAHLHRKSAHAIDDREALLILPRRFSLRIKCFLVASRPRQHIGEFVVAFSAIIEAQRGDFRQHLIDLLKRFNRVVEARFTAGNRTFNVMQFDQIKARRALCRK